MRVSGVRLFRSVFGFALGVCIAACAPGCAAPESREPASNFESWKASLADAQPVARHDISGIVRGCTGEHRVVVRLHDEKTFGGKGEVGRASFEPLAIRGGGVFFAFEVPPGDYAISAFEDRNGNGRPDAGWFGQHERIGYHRTVPAWWTPFFHDVKFPVAGPVSGIDIELR